MTDFSHRVRSGAWKGHTGKRIRNVVNIGIGGSDLGPVMAYEALKHYSERAMTFRFVSNVDGTDFAEAVRDLDPTETLFIVSSKTFTTLETMTNAHTAREWSLAGLGGDEKSVAKHFVAVSTNARKGREVRHRYGQHVRVLGLGRRRYSMDSAIGLSTMIAIGPEHFGAMLGRLSSDGRALSHAPFERNLPVLMGLLTIWYNNFFGARDRGGPSVRAVPEAIPRLSAAVDHGEQRQTRHARWDKTSPTHGSHLLGRAGHQWPTLLLPADPSGDQVDPLRLHCVSPAAQSARPASRPA